MMKDSHILIRLIQLFVGVSTVMMAYSFTNPNYNPRKMAFGLETCITKQNKHLSPFHRKCFAPSSTFLSSSMSENNFFDDASGFNKMNGSGGTGSGSGGDDLFDLEELQKRISILKTSAASATGKDTSSHLSVSKSSTSAKPEDVHIILFNPDTENEGVHTIEFPKGSGNNVILAFESDHACEAFSQMLKDQHFFNPFPQKMKLEFLENYCETLGVSLQVIPDGMNIRPPKENVDSLGLNPSHQEDMEILDYIYSLPSPIDGGVDVVVNDGILFQDEETHGAWE